MVLLLLVPIAGFTQNGTVKGTVVDSEGEPVIGATVTEKGERGMVLLPIWMETLP